MAQEIKAGASPQELVALYASQMAKETKAGVDSMQEKNANREYSPLQLAFFGDAVYELSIRRLALENVNGHVDKLNKKTKQLANAVTQAKIADQLIASDFLSEEEARVFRRGRNAKSASVPKSCTPAEYRKATGLEALMGHLWLQDKQERILEILTFGICAVFGDSFFTSAG